LKALVLLSLVSHASPPDARYSLLALSSTSAAYFSRSSRQHGGNCNEPPRRWMAARFDEADVSQHERFVGVVVIAQTHN